MVELKPLLEEEREGFIRRNQAAFLEALPWQRKYQRGKR